MASERTGWRGGGGCGGVPSDLSTSAIKLLMLDDDKFKPLTSAQVVDPNRIIPLLRSPYSKKVVGLIPEGLTRL